MNRKIIAFLMSLAMLSTISACSKNNEKRYKATFLQLFDTVTEIVGFSESKEKFTEYSQKIYDYLNEYNQLYDIYHDYEGINNLKTIARLPDYAELQKRAQHTDIKKLLIDEKASTVYLKDPDMSLDVGAIAKGFAVEKTALAMENQGFTNGMISVGGNVRALGSKFNETGKVIPWNVGIQNPDLSSQEKTLYVLNLSNFSLVTSGIYERYYTVDGKNYHHIIDPKTLMPADHFVSVSIVCEDSGMADALSTAVFNMPYDQGLELVEKLDGVEAMWLFSDGTMMYSNRFMSLIKA